MLTKYTDPKPEFGGWNAWDIAKKISAELDMLEKDQMDKDLDEQYEASLLKEEEPEVAKVEVLDKKE